MAKAGRVVVSLRGIGFGLAIRLLGHHHRSPETPTPGRRRAPLASPNEAQFGQARPNEANFVLVSARTKPIRPSLARTLANSALSLARTKPESGRAARRSIAMTRLAKWPGITGPGRRLRDPVVMGILNVDPRQLLRRRPGFFDPDRDRLGRPVLVRRGGRHPRRRGRVEPAGGGARRRSTRNLRRVVPVVEALAARLGRADLGRHDQARGRPPGPGGRARRSSTTSRAARPGDDAGRVRAG